MLYIFHGSDIAKSGDKARSLVSSLRAKKNDATFISVGANDWSESVIEENIGGQGLFSSKYIIFLDRVTENSEAKEKIVDFIPTMHESANIFIVLEGKLNAELKKAFDKYAEKVVMSDEIAAASSFGRATEGKREFNIFALADAVSSRDRMKSWMIYRQAVDRGLESESIVGTLFWQVKSMILASEAKTAGECGLNPFVFSKAKRGAGNYSKEELRNLSEKLITIYHNGHRGMGDIELGVERVLLGLGR